MFRQLTAGPALAASKWGAYTLVLLLPGSFLVLPLLWLAKHLCVRSRSPRFAQFRRAHQLIEKAESTMNAIKTLHSAGTLRQRVHRTLLQRFSRLWRRQDAHQGYLAAATDHADLERRIRTIERASLGPAFVTFNH